MAKIINKGSWIKIGSLNKEDKKNYLISAGMFILGALFWGLHLNTVDGIFGPPVFERYRYFYFIWNYKGYDYYLLGS